MTKIICKWCKDIGMMEAHGHFKYKTECWFCERGRELARKRKEKDNSKHRTIPKY